MKIYFAYYYGAAFLIWIFRAWYRTKSLKIRCILFAISPWLLRCSRYQPAKHTNIRTVLTQSCPAPGLFLSIGYQYRNWQLIRNSIFTAKDAILLCLALFMCSETCPLRMFQNQQNYVYVFTKDINLMEKKRICNHLSISCQYSPSSPFYLVYLFEWRSGKYISSVASNSKESLFRQIKEYAHLNEQEQADLRKFILWILSVSPLSRSHKPVCVSPATIVMCLPAGSYPVAISDLLLWAEWARRKFFEPYL